MTRGGTYKIQFLDTILLRPYPNEEAIQIQIDDLANPSAPKLMRARAVHFIDVSILKELEREGFFARLAFAANCQIEFGFVDGYAGEKSLLEVKATAAMS
jgi:hypothetical protein